MGGHAGTEEGVVVALSPWGSTGIDDGQDTAAWGFVSVVFGGTKLHDIG
jgi:hypothetical protein